jgi:MFS family permease
MVSTSPRPSLTNTLSPVPDQEQPLLPLKLPWTPYIYAAVAALTTVAYGFNAAIIAVALLSIEKHWKPTPLEIRFIVSAMLAGATIGCLLASANKSGRKPMLLAANAFLAFGALASGLSGPSAKLLVLARGVVGLGVGMGSVVPGLLITEMSPAAVRGQLGVFNQISGFLGIVLSYCVGLAVIQLRGAQADVSALLFRCAAGVAVGSLLCAWAVLPESPRWLIGRGRTTAALVVLKRIYGPRNALLAQEEYEKALESYLKSSEQFAKTTRLPLPKKLWLLVLGLQVVQQAAGSGFLTYYAAAIFRSWGLSPVASVGATLLSTLPQLAVIGITLKWKLIESLGRKRLLLSSSVAVSVVLAYLCVISRFGARLSSWNSALFAVLLVSGLTAHRVAYAFGLAPVPSVLIAESVPFVHRSRVLSVGLALNWALNFGLTTIIQMMAGDDLAAGLSTVYGVLAVAGGLGCLFISRVVKETRGMALESSEDLHLDE